LKTGPDRINILWEAEFGNLVRAGVVFTLLLPKNRYSGGMTSSARGTRHRQHTR